MPVVSELELEIAALRLRVAEALLQLNHAEQVIREVCDGAGASLGEALRASVALGEVRNTLWNGPLPPNVVRFRRRSIFADADDPPDEPEGPEDELELTTAQELGAGSYLGRGNNLP